MSFSDLTGTRFGRLVVERRVGTKNGNVQWLCNCDCGGHVVTTTNSLNMGQTRSCGCLHREIISAIGKSRKSHGQSNSRLYKAWAAMKVRCFDANSSAYSLYGGRGISVCDEWKEFEPFRDWALANGYADNLTLDRIDNDGNYEPSNCRWVDMTTQSNNKRNNRHIEINGEVHTLAEWSRISGTNRSTIQRRLREGWSPKDAVFHKLLRNRRTT